jgi:hypothetical protein
MQARGEPIRIEAPDAVRAAYLMQELVCRFRARLTQGKDARWEIVVEADAEPLQQLSELIGVVQAWVDVDEANSAAIWLDDRVYTMGNRAAGRLRSRAASAAASA